MQKYMCVRGRCRQIVEGQCDQSSAQLSAALAGVVVLSHEFCPWTQRAATSLHAVHKAWVLKQHASRIVAASS